MASVRVEVPVGARFGKLVVVCELPVRRHSSGGTQRWFHCRCDCGEEREVRLGHLRSGHTSSCGRHPVLPSTSVLEREDYHGMKGSPEWSVWRGIKKRCYKINARSYFDYGGRGIVMCSGWRSSFKSFLEDMGPRLSLKYSIDRKDNNGNYSCGHCDECISKGWTANCRWATRAEQRRNSKNVRMLTFRGETLCLSDMAKKYCMQKSVLHSRLASGWSLNEALLTPVRKWNGDRSGI